MSAIGGAVRVATTQPELEAIWSFRYRVYVEEMGRPQKYADHERRTIVDPLDAFAINFVATDQEGRAVGCVRTNFARDGDLLGYESLYAMSSVGDAHPSATSICTRLMVDPPLRNGTLALKLSAAVYLYGLQNGIDYNFIDCNAHLVGFFTNLGFTQHIEPQFHEEYGRVCCMRLQLRDRAHLETLRSPFLRTLGRYEQLKTNGTES